MPNNFYLFSNHIYKLLPQFIIGFSFYFPFHALVTVGAFTVFGPNIIRLGHHQRLMASWHMAFCSSVPLAKYQ